MSSLNRHNLAEDLSEAPVPIPTGPVRRVLLLIGGHTGRVGSALVRLLAAQRQRLLAEHRLEFHVTGTVNRRATDWHDPDAPWREDSVPRQGDDWPELITRFRSYTGPKLFVDCSASEEIAGHYAGFFQNGIGIVTPNKIANSGSQKGYRELRASVEALRVPYRYETTVGAALPLLGSLTDLNANGDEVQRVEAVLSGTLSFLFQRLNHGAAFSTALREARDAGLTEPHPGEDLKAQDSGRKLLILLREAGIEWEPERVSVHSLVPPELAAEADAESFLSKLANMMRPGRARWRKPASRVYGSSASPSSMDGKRGWVCGGCLLPTPSPSWPRVRTWCGSGRGAITRCPSPSPDPVPARR